MTDKENMTQSLSTELIQIVSEKEHQRFFDKILALLYDYLQADYLLLGEYVLKTYKVNTLSFFENGKKVENISYKLKGTPCDEVLISGDRNIMVKGVRQKFPENEQLAKLEVEGYIGINLKNRDNDSIGILAYLSKQKINNAEEIEKLFQYVLPVLSERLALYLAERKIEENNIYFKQIESVSATYGWLYDFSTDTFVISRGLQKLIELKHRHLHWQDVSKVLPDDSLRYLQRLLNEIVVKREVNGKTFMLKCHNVGKTKNFITQNLIEVKYNQAGEPQKIYGTINEVTDLFQLKKQEAFKQKQLELLNSHAYEGLYWAKKEKNDYIIFDVSRSLCAFTGFTKKDLIGQPCYAFSKLIIEGDKETLEQYWQNEKSFSSLKYLLRLPNHNRRYIAHSNTFFEVDGQKYAVGTFRDVDKTVRLNKIKNFFLDLTHKTKSSIFLNERKLIEKIFEKIATLINPVRLVLQKEDVTNHERKIEYKYDKKGFSQPEIAGFSYDFSSRKLRVVNTDTTRTIVLPLIDNSLNGYLFAEYPHDKQFANFEKEILQATADFLISINEKLKLNYELLQKEKKYYDLVHHSFDIIGTIDLEGRFEYISSAVEQYLGHQAEDIIGKPFLQFFEPLQQDDVLSIFKQRQKNEEIFTQNTWEIVHRTGELRIINVRVKNRLENKRLTGFIFNAKDITNEYFTNLQLEILNKINNAVIADRPFEKMITYIYNFINKVTHSQQTELFFHHKETAHVVAYYYYDKHKRTFLKEFLTKKEFDKKLKKIKQADHLKNYPIILSSGVHANMYLSWEGVKYPNLDLFLDTTISKIFKTLKVYFRNQKLTREIEEKLQEHTNLIEAIPDILYLIDNKGVIKYLKYDVQDSLVKAPGEYLNKSLFDLYHPKFAEKFIQVVNRVIQSGKKEYFDYYLIKNKRVKYYNSVIAPYDSKTVIVLERDITDKKEMEEKHISEVIAAQEKEKNRFAKDMHDGLGQILLAAKMNLTALDSIKEKLTDYEQEIYDKTMNLLAKAVHEARSISHGLMSRALREFGLEYAVNDLVKNINHKNLNIIFNSNLKNIRFPQNTEIGIYRIIQEIFNNIIKHSEAKQVEINLSYEGNNLLITITDDGKGFDLEKVMKNAKGIGVQNIQTRVNYLKGEIEIQTAPGKGTAYFMKFNINQ